MHLRSVRQEAQTHLHLCLRHVSRTRIVRCAYHMLMNNLFTDPVQKTSWNTHQCFGFLLHACLLQQRWNEQNEPQDPDATIFRGDFNFSQCSIFTGAAGTGKTALLQACDVLTELFFPSREGSVMRSAPTRTAARLNNGDTCHAAWALPWASALGPNGRLSDAAYKKLAQKIKGKQEIS